MSVATQSLHRDAFLDLRKLIEKTQRSAASWTAAVLSDTLGMRPRGEFGILMYHRVADAIKGHPFPTWNVTPNQFRKQLSGLLKRGFLAWPLRKVLAHQKRKLPIPKRVFVVTFDDGYENVFTQAFPILRELNVPATVFLATSFLNSFEPLPFDDWASKGHADVPADSWRAMTDDQCREMQSSGLIELAAHTHTHQDFRNRPAALTEDLRICRTYLQEHFGIGDPTFAFPYGTKRLGYAGPVLAAAARKAGMICSLTTDSVLARVDGDPFDWGRLTAEQSDTAATLAGKLTGWYSILRESLSRLRRVATVPPAQSHPAPLTSPAPSSRWR